MNVDELKPGAELDALVAEKVMGWASLPDGFYPSTRISDAWIIIPYCCGYMLRVQWLRGINKWRCEMNYSASAEASTAPHAICLAALRAVMKEAE